MTARKKTLPIGKRSRQLVQAARKPAPSAALEDYLETARLEIEQEALVTISMHLFDLFEDKDFKAGLLAAAGKKKLSERFLEDSALDIKKRVLKDLARIYTSGLY